MDELKKKIEAILFSVGKYISLEDIAQLCRKDEKEVKDALLELCTDYEHKKGSLVVISDGNMWKLTTREEYGNVVRNIVSETELTKSQLETLAVIAFKYPIKQSDLIKIRTNKAYEHLSQLEEAGYITRQRYGRSKLIKLTDKFFEYFDLPKEKLKDRFKGFEDLAKTIESKEEEAELKKAEQRKISEQAKKQEEKEKKLQDGDIDIDLEDEKDSETAEEERDGETYDEKEQEGGEVKEKPGEAEIAEGFGGKESYEEKKGMTIAPEREK
ncbi:SMC-Scp complex subunit ScpB [Candidatus Woesearchaeota archaeon]|nr:SMC-Scp complex subunit ScpB [Candidatus Woesearchaeota archaeon]